MNIGNSVSRLDLGLQNSSAMAYQARGLSQLRIKFYNTIVAGLQIVLLLTVLPQGKLAEMHFSIFYGKIVRDITRVMIFFIVRLSHFRNERARTIFLRTTWKYWRKRELWTLNDSNKKGLYIYRLKDIYNKEWNVSITEKLNIIINVILKKNVWLN